MFSSGSNTVWGLLFFWNFSITRHYTTSHPGGSVPGKMRVQSEGDEKREEEMSERELSVGRDGREVREI